MSFFRNNHEARKSKKAFRATEQGIAGHKAATAAIAKHTSGSRFEFGPSDSKTVDGGTFHGAQGASDKYSNKQYRRGGGHVNIIKKEDN